MLLDDEMVRGSSTGDIGSSHGGDQMRGLLVPGLVHVVLRDGAVLLLQRDPDLGLLLGEHEPVAVVVVPDVLLVQVREDPRVVGAGGLVEVVDDEVVAVGVLRRDTIRDHVLQHRSV